MENSMQWHFKPIRNRLQILFLKLSEFKGALSGLRQFLATESLLKAHLKSPFRSQDI